MMKKVAILVIILTALLFGSTVSASGKVGTLDGGGQIIEEEGPKRPDWLVISFGGWVDADGTSIVGEWEVNFHDVGVEAMDQSKFHTTEFTVINFYPSDSGTCNSALNLTALGEWNNIPGYKMIFRAGDFGSPGNVDTVRVELFAPGGAKVYDTNWADEFKSESTCVGTARTGLDAGNITIVMP